MSAEQAVLGAILLDPGQLAHLGWLAPAHFERPAHRALFSAMCTLRDKHHPALAGDDVPLSWITDAVAEAGRHVRGLTDVYAHSLVQGCPHPEHAPVYGRMVLEGAIHRTITQHAIRLHQAARADSVRGDVEGALHQADVLTGVLRDLSESWGAEARPALPSGSSPLPAAPAPAESVLDDERFLLSVLIEQPGSMDAVVNWLRPSDFSTTAHGLLYQCLGALHHRGEPIDRLTVLWEAQRRGLLADGTLTREQITALADGVGAGDADWLGQQVIRSSLTRTAAASARAVRDAAEDETLTPGRLISHALHALGPLDDVRARWDTAIGGTSPPPAPEAREPQAEQVHAALARSTPRAVRHVPYRPARPSTAPSTTPSRSHHRDAP
nr:DnaB-like helicase N-terminal domain-containing protein [Streptomyces sp. SID11385]